jgi:replicative DNA helicase
MDRGAAEAQILGTLCNQAGTSEQRDELVKILDRYAFLEPEHQIVFASIRSLLRHDRLSNSRLAVHLNNRGFPDVDLEKYCAAALANIDEAMNLARRLCPLANGPGAEVRYDIQGKSKHDS